MKNQSKPRIKLALHTETVRALAAAQLTGVVGGIYTLPPACRIDITVSYWC